MGYYKDKNTDEVLIDEVAADIVREIFQKYLTGFGLSTIARDILAQPQKPKIRLQSRKPIYTKMFLRTYRYAEPIEWLIKYFKYLYSFMECEKDKLCGFNAPHITYRIDTRTEPKLVCDYSSLKAVIDLAFAKAVTDEKNPLRYCKHCGKVFYAKDSRSEFCSPKCRNQFNVYKSRAKR